ncbi:7-carboxy-7-deazaguanine synthase [Acetobacter thailandicus]|uniref:7-carboxy-7-deazaguanine synthase n=1 Tax=Acetobacter thailandicus TaxID=1502842 RepID=UPI001BAAA789|nr:7-carboxy-7-deazaguanine synthase [Acetobacter thailandicus]MBS0979947.1 7-carboxy-7-deazaguanine synthase [Acetobacter thailandicus]MBS0985242.1 7-carboxy-7-deazaguanine synthase [Acetobacter thailandicus]
MTYSVKEIFLTLQGEGGQAGRAAVFCRFTGCNLWSGRSEDREKAQCQFCDTDFIGTDGPGGGKFETAEDLASAIALQWPADSDSYSHRLVVFTGGEPLLQLDDALISAMHKQGFSVAVESNGTIAAPETIDWVCISPKAGTDLVQTSGTELKLVYPQPGLDPASLTALDFKHFWLQPMDGANQQDNIQAAIRYCLQHPQWGLSLQTHKLTGIP